MEMEIPEISIGFNGQMMSLLGMGTAVSPPVESNITKLAVLEAMKLGYRHFDTASVYHTEQPLGEAMTEAISLGLIQSRDDLFITSKLWSGDAHGKLVVPALKRSLQQNFCQTPMASIFISLFDTESNLCRNLKLEYLDLYLIHRPVSSRPGNFEFPKTGEDFFLMDFKSVWEAMENCQKLGLTKSIGVSNFTCKKLAYILSIAKIPPAINQVEVSPLWQQQKLREFRNVNGVIVTAYAPLGAKATIWGNNRVLECEELIEIAKAKGKTLAQVCLRWVLEQGVSVLVKSFNKERMKENLGIFDWSLSDEENQKIRELPRKRVCPAEYYIFENGPIKTLEELWDGEI